MNKTLIIYPHGIGDCILATPALRAYKRAHMWGEGAYIGFAMLERLLSSELLKNCPYIDKLYGLPDPHNDYNGDITVGMNDLSERALTITKEEGYDAVAYLDHTTPINKIKLNFSQLKLDLVPEDEYYFQTEVFLTDEDREFAKAFVQDRTFTFIHGSSPSVPPKNFPPHFLKQVREEGDVIEVGVDFLVDEFPINKQFAVMELAEKVYVIDSAFYHAAHALNKKVDIAYFNRGKGVYNRVKPLHTVEENIVFEL